MTYKHIEASRNTRLWITQVMVPVATLATSTIIAVPEARKAISKGATQVKESIKKTFTKKESIKKNRLVLNIKANNRDEALAALEALAKQVFESDPSMPISKSVYVKDPRKV